MKPEDLELEETFLQSLADEPGGDNDQPHAAPHYRPPETELESKDDDAEGVVRPLSSSMVSTESFNFSDDFQSAILAAYIERPDKFQKFGEIIRPEYFNGLSAVEVIYRLKDFVAKRGRMPNFSELGNFAFVKTERKNPERAKELMDYVVMLSRIALDETGIEFLAEMAMKFAQERALFDALRKIHLTTQEGKKFDVSPLTIMEQALEVGTDREANPAFTPMQLYNLQIDPKHNLLGDHFLAREGGLVMVAPSGQGKSSASMQQDILWGCGKPAFGIRPNGALKILCIQGEDDTVDLHTMAKGVIDGLKLSDVDRALFDKNVVYRRGKGLMGEKFFGQLLQWVRCYQPDLIRINPLNSFLADDTDKEAVAKFFMEGLDPMLVKYRCGCVVMHHTPKTNSKNRDTREWKPSDFIYAGAGAHKIYDWARSVIAIDPTHDQHVFNWIAAKKGTRIGWKGDFDAAVSTKYFSWSRKAGEILWSESSEEEIAMAKKKESEAKASHKNEKYPNDVILAPLCTDDLTHTELWEKLQELGCRIGKSTLSERLESLRLQGKIRQENGGKWSRTKNRVPNSSVGSELGSEQN